ncbi:MAG: NAD(P)H-dependent oxidoreductase [Fusobacteriaceae bacterium]|nr:NAD(P)H-dependent oxidoreductase [Fusobacteriaceae bacterium]MBN2838755.1 NAD(P)H-dependent oxidoreductase [Fusobacteriaceae bacterium]
MKKVLYIKANPKSNEVSNTFKISEALVEKYKKDGHEVVELDLYKENLRHLDGEVLGKLFSGEDNEVTKYVNDVTNYDEYIIAAPMWNLSIPSILKTYIDHIMVAGKTFAYTENGPVGLLKGKKVVHVTTRGGFYSEGAGAAYEMGDRYLRTIYGFMGVTDFETVTLEGTNVLSPEDINANLSKLIVSL